MPTVMTDYLPPTYNTMKSNNNYFSPTNNNHNNYFTNPTTTTINNNNNKPSTTTIVKATVISFEKRNDQKIWYMIRVEPLNQKKYLISRQYQDFIQFSSKLHERFSSDDVGSPRCYLPPKIKHSRTLNLLPPTTNKYVQRVHELNSFLTTLFANTRQSTMMTESWTVLEFFGVMHNKKTRPDEKNSNYLFMQEQDAFIINEEDSIMAAVVDENINNNNTIQSRWKRLRCTSFLANNNNNNKPQPVPSTSTTTTTSNGLSLLCSQAANRIMHRGNNNVSPQPSLSTPSTVKPSKSTSLHQPRNKQQVLKKSKSTLSIYSSNKHSLHQNAIPLLPPTPTTPTTTTTITYNNHPHEIKATIKLKIIYNVDNIIVIQVPRSISLLDLRSKIIQKFSDGLLQQDVVLLFHDNSSSCCSIATSSTEQQQQMVLPAVLINKEQDLKQLMNTKWNRLEKVTLRCIM